MNRLKPKLILTKPARGGVSGFTFFFTLLIAFALGVFVGMRIEESNIQSAEKRETNTASPEARVQVYEKKPSKEDQLSIATAVTKPLKGAEEFKPQELKPLGESKIDVETEINKYTIQVAAFKGIERAQRIANELKEKGYDAYIVPTYNSRGGAWNLIRVGKFKTKEEALDFASLFQKKEGMEAIVEELNRQ
ncbi:MAG: hypothetical protein C4291_01550 [Candidatus Dadabacteria bacterium]